MFNDLFEECVKEAAKPVTNPDDRQIQARGLNRLAELRVAALLVTVHNMVQNDPDHALRVLGSRIAELENGKATNDLEDGTPQA